MIFLGMMNYTTTEMYWGMFVPNRCKPRHSEVENILNWCGANNITVIGHALVWNHFVGTLNWLLKYPKKTHEDL